MDFGVFTLALVLFYTGCHIEQNSALQLTFNELDRRTTVDIRCAADSVESSSKEIVLVEIGKDPATVLAGLRSGSSITVENSARTDMTADGKLDSSNPTQTYLTLTLANVKADDAGMYTCIIYYRDQTNQLKEDKGKLSLDLTSPSFAATMDKSFSPTVGGAIIFPVVTKKGHGYDPKTGVYTAPMSGTYVFHLTVTLGCKGCVINVKLMANNVMVAMLHGTDEDRYDQSSISTVVSLDKGQEVKAVVSLLTPASTIYGTRYTTFSGYLISPL